jgi:1-deoxy-D-xylulose-5-phosphate synthase
MVATAVAINDRPSALRYPRGEGTGIARPAEGIPLEIGKGRIVREGNNIAILNFGARMSEVLLASERLAGYGLSPTIADARFAKPLDTALIRRLAKEHEVLITIEEGAMGGFGAHVMHFDDAARCLPGSRHAREDVFPGGPLRRRHSPYGAECPWSWRGSGSSRGQAGLTPQKSSLLLYW